MGTVLPGPLCLSEAVPTLASVFDPHHSEPPEGEATGALSGAADRDGRGPHSHPNRPPARRRSADPVTEVAAITGELAALVSLDLSGLDDVELLALAAEVEGARKRLDALSAVALAEVDERAASDARTGLSTRQWLSRTAGLAPGRARKRLRVARALVGLLEPARTALADGRIGHDHAEVLTDAANPRIAPAFAELVPALIDDAQTMTFPRWRRHVGEVVDLLDADGAPPPDEHANRLHITRTLDGRVQIEGTFDALEGTYLLKAVDARADQLFRRYRQDADQGLGIRVPHRATLRALALVDLIAPGAIAPPGPDGVDEANSDPPGHRTDSGSTSRDESTHRPPSANSERHRSSRARSGDRHDGSAAPRHGAPAGSKRPDTPSDSDASPSRPGATPVNRPSSSDPTVDTGAPDTTLLGPGHPPPRERSATGSTSTDRADTTDPPDATSPPEPSPPDPSRRARPVPRGPAPVGITLVGTMDEPGIVRTHDGVTLRPDAAAHLLCDARYRALVTDRLGQPLTLGRHQRHATDAQRHALAIRDGACTFPGCDAPPAWCDAHHIVPYPEGETTPDNLTLLCRHHHRTAHRPGWTLRRHEDGTLTWTNPWGTTRTGQRHGRMEG